MNKFIGYWLSFLIIAIYGAGILFIISGYIHHNYITTATGGVAMMINTGLWIIYDKIRALEAKAYKESRQEEE